MADLDPTDVVSLLDALEDPGERRTPSSPGAVHAGRRRAGRAEPARGRTGVGPGPPGGRHAWPGRRAAGHAGVRPVLPARPARCLPRRCGRLLRRGRRGLAGRAAGLPAGRARRRGRASTRRCHRTARRSSCSRCTRPRAWSGRRCSCPALMQGMFPSDRVTDNWVTNSGRAARRVARRRHSHPAADRGLRSRVERVQRGPETAAGTPRTGWPTWRSPGQSNCWWPAGTRGSPNWSGPGRRRATCGRSYRGRPGRAALRGRPPGEDNPLVRVRCGTGGRRPLTPRHCRRREARLCAGQVGSGCRGGAGAARAVAALDARNGWLAGTPTLTACPPRRRRRSGEGSSGPAVGDRAGPAHPTRTPSRPIRSSDAAAAAGRTLRNPVPPLGGAHSALRWPTFGLGQQPLVDPDDLPDRADAGTRAGLRG